MKAKTLLFSLVLVLCLFCVCGAYAWAEAPYTEQLTTVYTNGEDVGALTLRFYEETPHVPYLGIRAYSQFLKGQSLSLRENGDGSCSLVNGIGAEIRCDAEAGIIEIPDWGRFFDMPLPLEDRALGWKDTGVHFVRITAVEYEGEAAPVTLDFAQYGIKIYADQDDVYLPVSTLSNMMTDIATNHLLYNGENLFAETMSLSGEAVTGFFESERLRAEIQGQERPEDLIRQSYADLCFAMDHFYGYPGKAPMEEKLAAMGLDQALTNFEIEGFGDIVREGLLSTDLGEYLSAMNMLFMRILSDGHTIFTGFAELARDPVAELSPAFTAVLGMNYTSDLLGSSILFSQVLHETIPLQRAMIWGEETYREYGSTAIIRLDSFMPDVEAWASYYSGEGPLPEDPLGIVVSGLRRAADNPEIENVIFDLSCNSGGSPDVMMAILAMTTGQTQIHGLQKLTGQRMTFTFEVDANLDGVFDEKDKEARYDFNYGVLVTRHAFSCGNLFPIVIQESGAVLIGEPSSGGSCCIQIGTDAEGFRYILSSAQWQLRDSQWNDVEGGCRIDIPIEPAPDEMANLLLSILGLAVDEGLPSFAEYFDDAKLDGLMNDWYQTQAGMDLAA